MSYALPRRAVLLAAALVAAAAPPRAARAQETSRGAYLAIAGDCVVCHTMSEGAPFAGGLKMATPLGAIYSPNITPDADTGIGGWSYEDFDGALRKGVSKDGRRLYPAMPYPSYAQITDEDSRALFEYFSKEAKPVHQLNTRNEIAPPWNARWPLAVWNLVGAGSPFRANAAFDEEWNRGAYLVQGLGHCGACHTPRGALFQEKAMTAEDGAFLAGANLDNWSSPNLRGDLNTGLGRWTTAETVEFLKTGHNIHGAAFGAMRDVVAYSTGNMNDADLAAMAKYLSSLPPSIDRKQPLWVEDSRDAAALAAGKSDRPGAATYLRQCASCHGADGKGGGGLPPLAGNAAVLDPDATSIVNIALNGAPALEVAEGEYGDAMPQFRTFLDDRAMADVATFIRSTWGNRAGPVLPADVAALRKATVAGEDHAIIRQMR